jgi:tRNA A58 N-methylase Trm61
VQEAAPGSRVAYVDIDPVAVAHRKAILAGHDAALAVLHFVADAEDPWRIVATLRDALAPGSYLVLWRPGSPGDVPADPSRFANLVGVARKG